MRENSFSDLFNANSYIIDSAPKVGKFTFLAYLLTSLFKEKALVLTPQESYLFKRRINSLSKQYKQFSNLHDFISPLYLKENWHTLKQKYGYSYFITEVEQIIIHSQEKIIVMHRLGEFFEFQDRYDIENVYKALIKVASLHEKKIIFLANNSHENYEFIHNFAEEFSDITISIKVNEQSDRLISIKNLLLNQEYPLMSFQITQKAFLLDYYNNDKDSKEEKIKNVLIAELDHSDDNLRDICSFIFQKPNFVVKYANSTKTILQEVFIRPDVIVVFMKRTLENLETLQAIKSQLPNSPIVAILDQNFVRAEDAQEAYSYGCDDLFSHDLELERLILALQKASKTSFYTNVIETLPKIDNTIKTLPEMQKFANECIHKAIFFTVFVFKITNQNLQGYNVSRKHDYICIENDTVYYLALNTAPKDIVHIKKRFQECELVCIWEPINHTMLEDCLHA